MSHTINGEHSEVAYDPEWECMDMPVSPVEMWVTHTAES